MSAPTGIKRGTWEFSSVVFDVRRDEAATDAGLADRPATGDVPRSRFPRDPRAEVQACGLTRVRRNFHGRLIAANLIARLLPGFVGGRVIRGRLYRWAGFDISTTAAVMGNLLLTSESPTFYANLSVGPGSTLGDHVAINLDGPVRIGRNVTIGPHALVYTGTHSIGPGSKRCNRLHALPVTIEDGAWIGLGVLVAPGVTIGHGSLVAAGGVVLKDVPPDSYVAGNPATVIRRLPWGDR